MNVLELFRSGLDTLQIAEKLGIDEGRVYNMLSAYRKEEEAARSASHEANSAKISEPRGAFL